MWWATEYTLKKLNHCNRLVFKCGKIWEAVGGKWRLEFGGSVFCLGKVRQIHEAVAVESPCAEAEPVVVFRTSLLLTPTHWLLCRPSVLGVRLEENGEIHTGSNTPWNPSTTISSKTLSTTVFYFTRQVCASFNMLHLTVCVGTGQVTSSWSRKQ